MSFRKVELIEEGKIIDKPSIKDISIEKIPYKKEIEDKSIDINPIINENLIKIIENIVEKYLNSKNRGKIIKKPVVKSKKSTIKKKIEKKSSWFIPK